MLPIKYGNITTCLIFTQLLVSGCAPSVIKLHTDAEDIAVVTSDYDDLTESLIQARFGEDKEVDKATVLLIDGKNVNGGEEVTYLASDAYNNRYGRFRVEVEQGGREFLLSSGVLKENNSSIYVKFWAESGYTYFLGMVSKVLKPQNFAYSSGRRYRWLPIVFDMTTHEFVNYKAMDI